MIGSLVVALLQSAAWTVAPSAVSVGDTVRIVRQIGAAPGVQARLAPLSASTTVQPLSDPVTRYSEATLTIGYSLAVFAPGRHGIAMPAVELAYPDGRVETLPGDTAWVTVQSVLPASDTALAPQPSLGPLARRPRSIVPLVIVVTTVAAPLLGWALARRRVRPPGGRRVTSATAPLPPLARWTAAGELRAVAAHAADLLRDHIAERVPRASRHLDAEECIQVLHDERPEWPLRELERVLHDLERARFAPAVPGDIIALVEQTDSLVAQLDREPAIAEETT